MAVKLSGEQLAQLAVAKDAGDRIAYYSLLSDYGDAYGKLALAVVNSNPGGGATASFFITTQSEIEGNPLDSNELASISMNLMQADYAARIASGGSELGYAQIQNYHQEVFGLAGLTPSAWTANFPLNYLDTPEEKQELWTTLINSGSAGSATAIFAALSGGLVDQDPNVIAYLGKLVGAGVFGLASSSNQFGDYRVSINGGGLAIGGTPDDDIKIGSQHADVLMGFDGSDTLTGGNGADRLYGGAGDDIIVAGNLSSGFDPSLINYDSLEVSSHSEWDDGERDLIVGGAGNNIFIVGGGVDAPNVQLTDSQIEDRAKLDLIDGADGDFTVYAQWVQDEPGNRITVTAKVTSDDLAGASPWGSSLWLESAVSSVYYADEKFEPLRGSDLFAEKVYNAASKEAILYINSLVNSYTNILLFGIKNYLTFDPSAGGSGGASRLAVDSSGGWTIEGDNTSNSDLTGTNGDDTVFARDGNDTIDASTYGGGADWYYGGAGFDTISYATSSQNLTISFDSLWGATSVLGSGGESDYFTDIERIIGGTGNDSISGTDADETFAGGGGNDTIIGGGGLNTIDFSLHTSSVTIQFSGFGQGTATGLQSGQDTFTQIQNIVGSQGNDVITGDSATNVIDGQNGSDQINGGGGLDVVSYLNSITSYTIIAATGGYLQIWDYAYTDTIINVETFSFAGVNFLSSVVAAAAASITSGTAGVDTLTGTSSGDAIFGGAGNDTIFGLDGNDLVYGGEGQDTIFAGDGINNINGGEGSDTLVIDGAESDFTITIQSDRSILITGSGVTNHIAEVEWIAFDAPDGQNDTSLDVSHFIEANSAATVSGTVSSDNLTGTAGQDTINGFSGNDTIFSLDGDDRVNGGTGDDVIFAGGGTNTIDGGDGSDTVIIEGAHGDFVIDVREDNSILISGVGLFDTITGAEWIVFDAPDGEHDTSVNVADLLEAHSSTMISGTSSIDNLTGTAGQDTISGLGGNDTILGMGGDDVIDAGSGADVIFAGTGTNVIEGGEGSDTLIVDGDYDDFLLQVVDNSEIVIVGQNVMNVVRNTEWVVFDAPGAGSDVSLDAAQFILENSSHTLMGTDGADTLDGGVGLDTINGRGGDDSMYGHGSNDILYGDAGNDTIFGNDGNDNLVGGDGNDFLVGGAGTDTFGFGATAGQDWIDDFEVGVDKIDVSGIASLSDFSDVLANAEEWVNGTTWLYADANNYIRLQGVSTSNLQATDFIFA